ncbi:beta-lactamase family protein [Streptomyces roseirectus]|uniref:Beta-lactamase family protein n=1 Tax=Streptomyces roseirectus TaxID=2768066 RepID=A0A7H0IPH4_9ACTN|nr:serine hydrolase domain-containing protein [Streptomyces roseirectus]QNP74690.1 beta-lactamase family protein [Streptomyces roseirectus]
MNTPYDTLHRYADDGSVPGAVGLVARGDDVEVVTAGSVDVEGTAPMARDSIFRLASLTKSVTAAAVMTLVDDGVLTLDAPIERWLPELAKPNVVRTPDGPVEDVVPAARPVTVEDLLSFRTGWGFPADFSLPAVRALFTVQLDGRPRQEWPAPDVWLNLLAQVPMVSQPGESWLYTTSSDIQGVLVARASGRSLPDYLAERFFEPLGMRDTGFGVPESKQHRFTAAYLPNPDGTLTLASATDDPQWTTVPRFPSGGGGLVSTADDWLSFARMLLSGGEALGHRVLTPASVRRMTTNHLTAAQRAASTLFLAGQGWGYGGQVDLAPTDPWNTPGRYGWLGGTGTAAHIVPTSSSVTILLTQVALTGPVPSPLMRDFWRSAAG